MAGLSVAFDARCEEMWLAWRYGALPGPGAAVAGARAASTSGRGWSPTTSPSCRRSRRWSRSWPTESLADVRLLIMGGEACPPELGGPAGRRRPRGVEHLRPDGGHRRRVRRAAHRRGAGADRAAARRLGPRRRRRGGAAGRRGRDGRADHRRRRAGPLPRPGQGRREVRRDADPRLGAGLPQRRPGRERPGRAAVRRPRRRPGQARRPADRARRGRLGTALGPGRGRRRGRGAQDRRGQPAPRRLRRDGRDRSTRPRPSSCSGTRCRPRWSRGSRWSTYCPPAPPARWTATRCRGRCPARRRRRSERGLHGTDGLARGAVARAARAPTSGPRPTTSSTSAAAASPRRSWSPGCGPASPRWWSATSTSTPRVGHAGQRTSTSSASPAPPRTGWSRRPRSRRRPARSSRPCCCVRSPARTGWSGSGSAPGCWPTGSGWTLLPAGTVVAAGRRLAGLRHAAGPDAAGRGRRPAPAADGRAG